MILKFEAKDLDLIAGYLHDSAFELDGVAFEPASKTLAVTLSRPCHESPQRSRVLGIVPIVRFATVPAVLTIHNVRNVSSTFRHQHAKVATYTHSLVDLTIDGDVLTFDSDGATIRATLDGAGSMELRDVGPPSERPQIVDLFSAVSRFDGMLDELQRLRSDA